MPIYQTSTFVQPSASEFGAFDYTRSGNPTRVALETLIAGLEDAHSAFCFTSGMAALSCVTQLVGSKPGDDRPCRIIASSDLYGGMHRLLSRVVEQTGTARISFVDTSKIEELEAALADQSMRTALIHIESPCRPVGVVRNLN